MASSKATAIAICDECDFFLSPARHAYVSYVQGVRRVTSLASSKDFMRWLLAQYRERTGDVLSSRLASDVVNSFVGSAEARDDVREICTRVGPSTGTLYVDLVDGKGTAIAIAPDGSYGVVQNPPVAFLRFNHMEPLPLPEFTEEDAGIPLLRSFIPNCSDADFLLIVCWLLQAFRPTGEFPVLVLKGETSSGKSELARMLRRLVSPSAESLVTMPEKLDSIAAVIKTDWCTAFDNVSYLDGDKSDLFCQVSTEGYFKDRAFHRQGETHSIHLHNPLIITTIEDVVNRDDLATRVFPISLAPLESRTPVRQLREDFDAARPVILGALIKLVATAMRDYDSVDMRGLADQPRMFDMARWCIAAGVDGDVIGTMNAALKGQRLASAESDMLMPALLAVLIDEGKARWEVSPTDLLERVKAKHKELNDGEYLPKRFPAHARSLGNRLRRIAPLLRLHGVEIDTQTDARVTQGENKGRRVWRVRIAEDSELLAGSTEDAIQNVAPF